MAVKGRGPLLCLDEFSSKPLKQRAADSMGDHSRVQRQCNMPAAKRIARPRAAGQVDFGVQIYAKPPPARPKASQVQILESGRSD